MGSNFIKSKKPAINENDDIPTIPSLSLPEKTENEALLSSRVIIVHSSISMSINKNTEKGTATFKSK